MSHIGKLFRRRVGEQIRLLSLAYESQDGESLDPRDGLLLKLEVECDQSYEEKVAFYDDCGEDCKAYLFGSDMRRAWKVNHMRLNSCGTNGREYIREARITRGSGEMPKKLERLLEEENYRPIGDPRLDQMRVVWSKKV